MWYLSQELVIAQGWQDAIRIVAEYDPDWEFVALLLKEQRQSVYRVGVPGLQPEDRRRR